MALLTCLPIHTAHAASSGALSYAQIEGFWIAAGGSPADAPKAAAITVREAGMEPGAIQQGQPYSTTGWGLWQITPGDSTSQFCTDYALLDPWNNAEAALAKFQAAGWAPWNGGAFPPEHYIPDPIPAPIIPTSDPGQFVAIGNAPAGAHNASAPGSTCGPAMPVARGRAAVASSGSGSVMFSVDPSNHIIEASYSKGWHVTSVGATVRADSPIATNSAGTAVYYFDTANRVSNLYHNSSGWHVGTIGGAVGANSGIVARASGATIFYTDTNGHLANAYYNSSGWHIGPIGGTVRAGSNLATNSTGTAVYYIDTANRISNGYHNSSGWHIGTIGGTVSIASGIAASAAGTVFYVDTSGRLDNAYHNSTGWHIGPIGGTVRPYAPLASSAAGTVFYVDTSNRIANGYHNSTGWHVGTIGGTVRVSTGLAANSNGHTVFYNDTLNRIANAYYSTGWHTAPIGGTTR